MAMHYKLPVFFFYEETKAPWLHHASQRGRSLIKHPQQIAFISSQCRAAGKNWLVATAGFHCYFCLEHSITVRVKLHLKHLKLERSSKIVGDARKRLVTSLN